MAVGVASPSAQGQAITNTVRLVSKALARESSGLPKNQARKVMAAIARTMGTKTEAIRSTSL